MRSSDWSSDVCSSDLVLLRAPFLDALVFLVRPCLEPRAQTVERVEERLQELVASRLGRVGRVAIGLRERDTVAFDRCHEIVCDLDDVASLAGGFSIDDVLRVGAVHDIGEALLESLRLRLILSGDRSEWRSSGKGCGRT